MALEVEVSMYRALEVEAKSEGRSEDERAPGREDAEAKLKELGRASAYGTPQPNPLYDFHCTATGPRLGPVLGPPGPSLPFNTSPQIIDTRMKTTFLLRILFWP